MSKRDTYNAAFFNGLVSRLHGTNIRLGVLIATQVMDGHRDVVFAAPTPPEPDTNAEECIADGMENPTPKPKASLLVRAIKDSSAVAALWSEHVATLRRVLPGGLEPCGCFVVAPEATVKEHLGPFLTLVAKDVVESLVLSVDPLTRKLSFWHTQVGLKIPVRPAQVKPDSHKDALLLWSAVPLDMTLPVDVAALRNDTPHDESGESNQAMLDSQCRAVEDLAHAALSRCTCGFIASTGSPDCDATLNMVDPTGELQLSVAVPKVCDELRVDFLHNGTGLIACCSNAQSGAKCVRQRCLVIAVAVVLRRDVELTKAIDILKRALASSASERLRLALQKRQHDRSSDPVSLPWRSFWRPRDAEVPLWCSSYCMPNEAEDVAKRCVAQALGCPVECITKAPRHLNEMATLKREHVGTYERATDAPPGRSALPDVERTKLVTRPAFTALAYVFVCAVLVLLVAMLVPIALRS